MKLLSYSAQKYLIFSAVLVLFSIPVFYIVLEKIFIHAVDESLSKQAALLPQYTKFIQSEEDLNLWKNLDWDIDVALTAGKAVSDKPFTTMEYSKEDGENVQYRSLQKSMKILNNNYTVTFKSSLIEKNDLILTVMGLQIALLLLLLLGSLGVNHYISKKIWDPFQHILNYLKAFDLETGVTNQVAPLIIEEFKELNSSVNDLTARVQRTYRSQKEFTENASHELQTPLAIIRSKLDLFAQEEQLSQSQSVLIEEMNAVLTGLEQLNTSLLMLAKMDNEQYSLNESFSISDLIKQIIIELDFFIGANHQKIVFQERSDLRLSGNQQLFRQLLTNLLLNSVQYSAKGSEIKVNLSSKCLEFLNPGEELPFRKEKLFERFSKKSGNTNGNGLGVAISQKIAQLHHMQLSYVYHQGNHQFKIHFQSRLSSILVFSLAINYIKGS